ncbi:MAG: hypothetical protein JXA37_12775 [Chloroflexia bacterium]|nr:hypothetical protein [Chloroflexia bacterium]
MPVFESEDELAGYLVLSIAVAPDGALWFGTDGGVSRFDGTSWTTYTTADGLANHVVWPIAVTSAGAVCFGTNAGLSCYLPSD